MVPDDEPGCPNCSYNTTFLHLNKECCFLTPSAVRSRYDIVDKDGNPDPDLWVETCQRGSWRDYYGLDALLVEKKMGEAYVDSLYWAVTTITTVGYGDRSPRTINDICFCMIAMLISVSFYAIILEQINRVHDVMSARHNASATVKNTIVQFCKWNQLSPDLMNEVVRFLEFRTGSLSEKIPRDAGFLTNYLSFPLKNKLFRKLLRPVLCRVRFFGWCTQDVKEEAIMKEIFTSIDTDGSVWLSMDEVRGLIIKCGLPNMSEEAIQQACDEMDSGVDDDEVVYDEFREWWYYQKHGSAIPPPCPSVFLDELCQYVWAECAAPEELIIDGAERFYGENLIVVMVGHLHVYEKRYGPDAGKIQEVDVDTLAKQKEARHDHVEWTAMMHLEHVREVQGETHHIGGTANGETLIGLQAVLQGKEYHACRKKTAGWVIKADSYADMLYIQREHLNLLLEKHWPSGQERMRASALEMYGMERIEEEIPNSPRSEASVCCGQLNIMDEKLDLLEQKIDTLGPALETLLKRRKNAEKE